MRQVPNFAVIGDGRMARHTCHYFDYLGQSYSQWSRAVNTPAQLENNLQKATHILVLISDDAIVSFIESYLLPKYADRIIIHFSGSLVTQFAVGAHPLNTFSHAACYDEDEYRQIPFMIDDRGIDFETLLPGLPNPHYVIAQQDKAFYHALCVLANNVSSLLWKKFFHEMQNKFDIQDEHLQPFLQRTFDNIKLNPETALTGPVARGDVETLHKNICALAGDPYQDILKAVIRNFT